MCHLDKDGIPLAEQLTNIEIITDLPIASNLPQKAIILTEYKLSWLEMSVPVPA